MKRHFPLFILTGFIFQGSITLAQHPRSLPVVTPMGKGIVNLMVDNVAYWQKMARLGYVEPIPYVHPVKAKYTSSLISADGVRTQDSPDVPVIDLVSITQTENSIAVDPLNEDIVLNSNNSSDWNGTYATSLFGADAFHSFMTGQTWNGSFYGAGEANSGDPAVAISTDGRWYVGFINSTFGQSVAWSEDQGQSWHPVVVYPSTGGYDVLDKNHLWVDNSPQSPFKNNVYVAWTNFFNSAPNQYQIEFSRSTDGGNSWSSPTAISFTAMAEFFNHGVNLHTGPNGEVYAVWSIYDDFPADENAIAFTKSVDGGITFGLATRIMPNVKGFRISGTSKDMRTNAFPCMTVDISGGPFNGYIYIVFPNRGYPGINTGSDIDLYLIRSADGGTTWSAPVRVNQDPAGLGKHHFFPWITCDPDNGNLCVVYYDDRNLSDTTQCETWVSYSYDAGNSWTDMKVSDVSFTPSPVGGLAIGYFGDYIGITSRNRKVYPVWTDNRTGAALTYVSPFDLDPAPNQPWVTYHSHDLISIPSQSPTTLNFGDSVHLSLGVENIGDLPDSNLAVKVTSGSAYILITDSLESYGTLDAGEIKTIPSGFAFRVSDTIPSGLQVRFDVLVTGTDTSWLSHFYSEAHAPGLKIVSLTIKDTTGNGNGNHRLDPGETTDAVFAVKNPGDFPCPATVATLTNYSDLVTVSSPLIQPLDTVHAGETKYVTYQLSVDDDAGTGSFAGLKLQAVSGLYDTERFFNAGIGQIVEDWESNSFTQFPWQGAGWKFWQTMKFYQYEGTYVARSGAITDDQWSSLKITWESGIDDSISFYRRTSSEPGYDFLYFFIDNVLQAQWSGEEPYKRVAFPVPAGTHTFEWKYVKDIYLSVGVDCAWVDYIVFPPQPLPVVNPGPDDTICAGMDYLLSGTVSGADSIYWQTYGDGTFDADTILTPVYTPGTNDIVSGKVRLRLIGINPYGQSSRSIYLTINGKPNAHITAVPKDTVCAGQQIHLSVDTTGITEYLWTPGNFTTSSLTVDSTLTGGIGTYWFRIQLTNQEDCINADSIRVVLQACAGIEDKSGDFRCEVYPNPNNGKFVIDLYSPVRQTVGIILFDGRGNPVFEEPAVTVSGKLIREINQPALPAGIYMLVVQNRELSVSRKVIIR